MVCWLGMSTSITAAPFYFAPDGGDSTKKDSLKFPIEDRSGNNANNKKGKQFDLKDPKNLNTEYEYDPVTKKYTIKEKIGDTYFRNPTEMDFDEFMEFQSGKYEDAYWRKRANTLFNISKSGGVIPKVELGNRIFDRIFGGTTIEVKPQGNVDMFFGGNWQNVQNPALVQSAQKYGIFDFDIQMNLNMLAKVGEKMRMNFNYNTQASFDFENQLKLEWTGQEDDIIRKLEAGYISFPLKSQLIQGVQSLFGIKAQLQFGRLMMTNVLSQQKSQRESFSVKGGAQTQEFEIKSDEYDYFRHFLLGQYFRENFNGALENYPIIQSLNNITRIEVWITNRQGTTQNVRDIVALQDLGESRPYNTAFQSSPGALPGNGANTLYSQLLKTQGIRETGTVITALQSRGLRAANDFEKTFARKLNPNEFNFNPQLGFISVNAQLQPDDVIGVAFEYTHNGKVYQVGEFSQSLPPDSSEPKVLFLKMLKSTTPDPRRPIWDLMMKNIYPLGASGVNSNNFILNVLYQDPGGGLKRFLPEGPSAGIPLLNLLNLDRLNNQGDPQPDGRFDYVEGLTIQAQQGKIIFPVLEPFGEDLKPVFNGDVALEKKYVYNVLYDSTKNIAIQFPQFNRFVLKGSFEAANSSEIFLGGFNIPQGSVNVSAGGQRLIENVDYTIDYGIGKLKIINSGVLSSGVPINVTYENNIAFGTQVQNFVGTRLDYFINNDFTVGSTILRLSERPYFNKVSFGDDPLKNTVIGLDANYQREMPKITTFLNNLPLIKTEANSMVTASGEVARLFPGHHRLIEGTSGSGEVYIDDFEGTRSSYDLKFPVMSWNLASTPAGATDDKGIELFPEARLVNNPEYGKNRAKLAWYNLDPCLADLNQNCKPGHIDTGDVSSHYTRLILQQEVFPNRTFTSLQGNQTTFDMAYFPKTKGPYNLDATNITADGELLNPETRWGGVMRAIDFSDFETANVEFIEFWMLDPFLDPKKPNPTPGKLYLNLGNISEDILKDSRKFFENGLPSPPDDNKTTTTTWSKVPKFQQQLTPAFGSSEQERVDQDLGYDGMTDVEERNHLQSYLDELSANFGNTSKAFTDANSDPNNDNYRHFRGDQYDREERGILSRYLSFNNPQGNSPVQSNNATFSNSFTNIPETEDVNRDNTLNENEQYFQYAIDVKPNMQVGENFIVNKQVTPISFPNGITSDAVWYQFKIPIQKYNKSVGGISDFRSIRFARMFMTGFTDTTVLRFARLELGRNQWRRYNFSLKNPGELVPISDNDATTFNLTSVSLEENGSRNPVNYVIPPGIQRQIQQGTNNQAIQLNEQALALQVCDLEDGDSRGVFKSLGMDIRQFKKIDMFIHAEASSERPLSDNDMHGFIRIGSDFASNYYEYNIPLKLSEHGNPSELNVWPEANNLNLEFQELIDAKLARNKAGYPATIPYIVDAGNGRTIVVVGNPNIGDAEMCMLGVQNPKKSNQRPNDNGGNICGEVWFNELRLANMEESGGWAAIGQADIQLADIATVKLSGNMYTAGYGNIDQRVNERARENFSQFDVSTTVNAGKLFPDKWGVQLPVYAGYNQAVTNPIFDPFDKDVKFEEKVANSTDAEKDSIRKASQDFTAIRSLNVQNVRVAPKKNEKVEPWDLQNFDMSYSFTGTSKRSPLIEKDELDEHNLSFGYTYAPKSKPLEPFKKLIKAKRKYLKPIRDFNINLLPTNFTFRNNMRRIIGETSLRNIDDGNYDLPINYFKFFTWTRTYNLRWNLFRSLSLDYSANNLARIDEPEGRIDTKEKKDVVMQNLLRGGRNTNFNHNVNMNYTVPFNKFPLTDWITARASYSSSFDFTRTSLLATQLGNTIGNTQKRSVNSEMNFSQLYNKVKILRIINQPKRNKGKKNKKDKTPKGAIPNRGKKPKEGTLEEVNVKETENPSEKNDKEKDGPDKVVVDNDKVKITQSGKKDIDRDELKRKKEEAKKKAAEEKKKKKLAKKKKREERKKRIPDPPESIRIVGRALMGLKRVSFSYNENMGTLLPGYMDSNQYFGLNMGNQFKPGADFAFGYQPNRVWLDERGNQNWFTRDSLFSQQLSQQYSQNYNITVNIEPFKDFRVDLNWKQTFSKNLTELFKDTIGGGNEYIHLNPYQTGSFDISFIAVRTLFQKRNADNLNQAFYNFEDYRQNISRRLGIVNPYTASLPNPSDPDYTKGYSRYQQNVLIPAFLAAYAGRDPETIPLVEENNQNVRSNPFKNLFPLPNWRLTYNGLARNKKLRKIFQQFTLRHTYNGSMSMNGFNSALMYNDVFGLGYPSFIDSTSGNYVPFFLVPNITITENFGPVVGIDATLQNSLNFKFEYKKSRTLSMSLIDFQLSETNSSEFTIGAGMRLKNVTIPTQYFNLHNQKSDVNMKFDFSIRDDLTSINRLDDRTSIPTRGQRVISISPSIDYLINKSFTVRFLYDRRRSIPRVSTAFPITTTRGGIMFRFLFGQ
jgi:cell surface protein SprA